MQSAEATYVPASCEVFELETVCNLNTETIEDIVHGKISRGNIKDIPFVRIVSLGLMHRMMQRSWISKNQTQQTDTQNSQRSHLQREFDTHTQHENKPSNKLTR